MMNVEILTDISEAFGYGCNITSSEIQYWYLITNSRYKIRCKNMVPVQLVPKKYYCYKM